MEGKTVILSVFIMSLVMAQIQVEAVKSCCPSQQARNCFNACRLIGTSQQTCASLCACKLTSNALCPYGYSYDFLKNSGDTANEYCKVGCVSSVCSALTTLQNSDTSETVNGVVDQCAKACSTVCAKGYVTATETETV